MESIGKQNNFSKMIFTNLQKHLLTQNYFNQRSKECISKEMVTELIQEENLQRILETQEDGRAFLRAF